MNKKCWISNYLPQVFISTSHTIMIYIPSATASFSTQTIFSSHTLYFLHIVKPNYYTWFCTIYIHIKDCNWSQNTTSLQNEDLDLQCSHGALVHALCIITHHGCSRSSLHECWSPILPHSSLSICLESSWLFHDLWSLHSLATHQCQ